MATKFSLIRIAFLSLLVATVAHPLSGLAENQHCSHNPLMVEHSDALASSWALDLLGYDDSVQADGLVGRLARKQFVASVVQENLQGTMRYRVRMIGFFSQEDALTCQQQLKQLTNIRDEHIRLIAPARPFQEYDKQDAVLHDSSEQVVQAVSQPEDNSNQSVGGMSVGEAIDFALNHNVQYREQVSQLPILDLDVAAASDPFSIQSNISSSSSQRVGSELGRDYHMNLSKKFSPGTNVGIGFGTSRFAGQSLSEASISITQPLLKGRGTLVNTIGIEEAEQNRLKQRNMMQQQQQQLILNVISAYYHAILQQQSMRIHDTTIKHSKNLLDSANAKFKFGMVSRMDVFRAELQMLEAEEALASAQSAHEKSLDDLKLLLGASISEDITLSDSIRYQSASIDDDETLITRALDSRQELLNLTIEQEMLVKRIEVAKNSMLPQLDVTFQVTQSGTAATFSKSTRLNDTRFGIGISGSPQFTHGAEKARYSRALLAHDFAQRKHQQMKQKIRSAVRDKIRQIRQGEKRIKLRERSMDAAEKQKQYAQVRYQKGLVDNAAVVDAEKSMVAARIGYLQAVVDYNIAVNALYKETGQLTARWQHQP